MAKLLQRMETKSSTSDSKLENLETHRYASNSIINASSTSIILFWKKKHFHFICVVHVIVIFAPKKLTWHCFPFLQGPAPIFRVFDTEHFSVNKDNYIVVDTNNTAKLQEEKELKFYVSTFISKYCCCPFYVFRE